MTVPLVGGVTVTISVITFSEWSTDATITSPRLISVPRELCAMGAELMVGLTVSR